MKEGSKRHKDEILRVQLENERSSFEPMWKDLARFISPRRERFELTDVNRGDRRNNNILDSTATFALRTMQAGMMSGVTSPARPWFRLTTPDADLADIYSVKTWLNTVEGRMATVFLRSNIYQSLPLVYGDVGQFATSALLIEEDFESVLRSYVLPVGSYYIANDSKGRVRVFMRKFQMTVRQLVQKFGVGEDGSIDWSRFSQYVKDLWDKSQFDTYIPVVHVIRPNEDYNPSKFQSKFKRYVSRYYEQGVVGDHNYSTQIPDDLYLKESGYDYFPVLCPRWSVTGEDCYGTDSPGIMMLGDIKQLQLGERRIFQAIEHMIKPPMVAPPVLRNQKISQIPGDVTYVDLTNNNAGLRPTHEVNPNVQQLEYKQEQARDRINRGFFADLFLMLANSDRRQITAREIDERHEEKLLALGPVLEQLNQDLLDPLIEITFGFMLNQGLIPPAPEELQGVDLKVEYISVMAQAQKLVAIGGLERFTQFVLQLQPVAPNILQKIDMDELVENYADITGINPRIVRPQEDVEAMRAEEARLIQNEQNLVAAQSVAKTAKDLSQTNLDGDNALARIAPALAAV